MSEGDLREFFTFFSLFWGIWGEIALFEIYRIDRLQKVFFHLKPPIRTFTINCRLKITLEIPQNELHFNKHFEYITKHKRKTTWWGKIPVYFISSFQRENILEISDYSYCLSTNSTKLHTKNRRLSWQNDSRQLTSLTKEELFENAQSFQKELSYNVCFKRIAKHVDFRTNDRRFACTQRSGNRYPKCQLLSQHQESTKRTRKSWSYKLAMIIRRNS